MQEPDARVSGSKGAEGRLRRPSGPSEVASLILGTGLGVGFFPFAPGTAGTLLPGVPLAWGLAWWLGPWACPAAAVVLFLIGLKSAGDCQKLFGRSDPPQVVLDEVVGLLAALSGLEPRLEVLVAGFLLFRVADVLKPWPAGLVDRRVPGGLGVMLDDVVAAAYTRLGLLVLGIG